MTFSPSFVDNLARRSRTRTPTRTNRFKRPALAAPPASLKVVAIPTINLLHTLNSTNVVWRPEPEKTTADGGDGAANKKQIKQVNDAEIIALIQLYPYLSVAKLANKLQISRSRLRARLDSYRHEGVLIREGAKKNGRWKLTEKFGGCSADGELLLKLDVPLDPELVAKVQKVADARGVPLDIAMHEILAEKIHKDNGRK